MPNDNGNNGLSSLKGTTRSTNGRTQQASGTLDMAKLKRIIDDTLALLDDEDFSDTSSTTSSSLSAYSNSHRPRYQ